MLAQNKLLSQIISMYFDEWEACLEFNDGIGFSVKLPLLKESYYFTCNSTGLYESLNSVLSDHIPIVCHANPNAEQIIKEYWRKKLLITSEVQS